MNKGLIYVLFCIFLISSVSALEFNLKEQVSDVSSLEASFGSRNVEVIKEQVFTELKSNDALKKEAVFSMDTSKFDFDFNRDIDVVFNEVCGKVTGFRISELKDGDYLVKADIENALCSDGTYGYKIDWMPKLIIGSNELINQKWAWWNQTFRLDNPNSYYLIIEATSVSVASLEINDVHIFNLSSTEWLMYENVSNNYQVSKAKVMKTLFYGTNGTNPRVNSTYITGLVALKTGDASDVGKQGFYAYQYAFNSGHKANGVFLDTTTNTNFNSWWYLYAENSGVGVTKDMTTNDTSAYSYSNPLSINASVEQITSEYGRWYINNTLIDTASTTPTNVNPQSISRGFMITKGNMTWSSTGGTFTYRDFYKNDSIPAFSYWNFSDYFSVRFIKWNGSYAPVNITMSNGTNTLNFTSSTGYITTNIANVDLSLWNISLTGDNYYSRVYTSYNVSTDIFLNTTILYTLTASSGVFGETSSIILNLSRGVNQSYSNADLIYNGVVYSSPTQTEYTGYTLFTQSVDNDVIGNFSYFWNVSLVDYGNVFNFSTVNGSHVVAGSQGNLAFYDEITKSLLVRNITLEAIGSLLAENYSTATGYLNISNLSTGSYVFRFKSLPEYAERFYLYDISGDFNLSLYLINGSTQIALTVKEQNDNVLSGAVIKIQRYDIDSNAYTTREIVSTNVNGVAYFEGLLNSEFYRFVVEYPFGTQVLETSPDYLRSTSLTLRVNLEALVFTDYFAVLYTRGVVTFNNATNNFAFDYNGVSVTQGCLYIYDDDISNTLLNTSCVAGSASIILINVANVSGQTYTAKGTVFINGEEYLLSVKSYTFPTTSASNLTTDNKKMFLLLTIFLIMVIGLLTLWNVTVFLMLTPLPLFVMSLIGLIPISRGVGVTIYLIAITLAILISKRS